MICLVKGYLNFEIKTKAFFSNLNAEKKNHKNKKRKGSKKKRSKLKGLTHTEMIIDVLSVEYNNRIHEPITFLLELSTINVVTVEYNDRIHDPITYLQRI